MVLVPNILRAIRFMADVIREARAARLAARIRYPGLGAE